MIFIFFVLFIVADTDCTVYFKEEFTNDNWVDVWTSSKHSGKKWGKFVQTAGKFHGDPEISKGIQTSEDARFYGLSAKFEPFSNKDKVLVLQYSVKHEQKIDCGGGYIKLFDCSLDPENLHGDTPYLIMFGPDICGYENRKVHVIFNYKGQNLLSKKTISCKDDEFTHLYTLIVKPDNTYIVKIDSITVEEGELENDWNFLLPRNIKDPKVVKPEDWDDDSEIEDPEDTKPEDWDQPELIFDKDAVKPVDWDDDMDGDWEPPKIKNPEYKGEWKARLVPNPKYRGSWIHPELNNPEYKPDPYLYKYDEICGVGFDLWQVKSGSIFDNVLIADKEQEALRHGETTWGAILAKEREMKKQLDGDVDDSNTSTDDDEQLDEDLDEDELDADDRDFNENFEYIDGNDAEKDTGDIVGNDAENDTGDIDDDDDETDKHDEL